MLSPSRITFEGGPPGSQSSSPSSSSHSSPLLMQILCKTAQATALRTANDIPLSNRFRSILHLLFKTPKAHSTFTHAEESSLLNAISLGSRVPSGYGFISQGESG